MSFQKSIFYFFCPKKSGSVLDVGRGFVSKPGFLKIIRTQMNPCPDTIAIVIFESNEYCCCLIQKKTIIIPRIIIVNAVKDAITPFFFMN